MPPDGLDTLRAKGTRGGAVTIGAQAIKFILYFGLGVVLARLLSPDDFGIFGIAAAIAGLMEIAKDGGMIVSVMQAETLTDRQSSALFWFNVAFGAALTLVTLALAPLAAWAYGDWRLFPLVSALATVFMIGGLSTQHRALLRRELRFAAIAACEIAALAAGVALAIFVALWGFGYWSLVCLGVTQEAVQTILVLSISGWWPQLVIRRTNVRPLIHFGIVVMAFDAIGFLNFKADNLIVGYFLGPATLGFYGKAYQLLLLPLNQIGEPLTGVVLPLLTRLRADPEDYKAYVGRCILLSAGFGMPIVAFLYGNADAFIALVFGRVWLPSAPIFRALAPAAFLMTVTIGMGWIFLSLGRARRQLPWTCATTALTLVAFFAGLPWGAVGVATGLSISRVILFIPTLIYTCTGTLLDWMWVVRLVVRPCLAALVALGISSAISTVFPDTWWLLFFNGASYALAYGLCWIVMPGGRVLMSETFAATKVIFRNA